ncbi:MAG: ATP-binding protein, partial [Acidobacteriota bacterium]
RLNDWLKLRLPPSYHRRSAERFTPRWSEVNRAHLVIGPRQAGKSTLVWNYLASSGQPVLYMDCEQSLIQRWCRSAPLFLDELEKLLPGPTPLFFDEVQHLDEAGLFFKGLVDRRIGVPILVTGSSSFHLGARTRESLAGRATRTRLLPFSLDEVCQDLKEKPELVRLRATEERLQQHLVYGGYPEVWLSQDRELLLTDLVESIILRDASDLFGIARPDAFRRILRLAAAQVGNLVNLSEWASITGINRGTAASYLEIMESSHITVMLPPFVGGRRSEMTSTPKIYLVDNGIRNRLVHDFKSLDERVDKGPLFENWVFSEIWKQLPDGASLHFWRSTSKAEVDFVVVRGEVIVALECKADRLSRPTLPRSARSFISAYQPKALLLVNTGFTGAERIHSTDIEWITPDKLSANLSSLFS